METVAIDTGERRQGKTRIILEKQFRLRSVDSGRAFPLRVPIVCSIVPSRLIYRQPMPRGIRELVFP